MQLDFFIDKLPDEITDLQWQWVQAVNARIITENTNIYEIIEGDLCPVFLSEKYYKAREKEMDVFCRLASYMDEHKNVFKNLEDYLDK